MTKKILSVQYIRAITIFSIVIWHAAISSGIPYESPTFKLIRFFFCEGTTPFLVISGFFFQNFIDRYKTKSFYLSKFKNVVIPYLILLIITSLILDVNFNHLINNHKELIRFILTPPNWSLWFIPMILTIFTLSPILYFLSYKNNFIIAVTCIIIVTFIPRGDFTDKNIYQFFIYNLIHYIPCFIFGMWYRMNFLAINSYISENFKLVIYCFVLLSCIVLLVDFNIIHTQRLSWSLYRIISVVFLIFLFEKFNDNLKLLKIMSFLGDISFTIFFIHMAIMLKIQNNLVIKETIAQLKPYQKGLYSLLLSLIILLCCTAIAIVFKKLLKKNSRYLIGY